MSTTVIAAAQAAGLHDSIMCLPQMYKTMISPYPTAPVAGKGSTQISQRLKEEAACATSPDCTIKRRGANRQHRLSQETTPVGNSATDVNGAALLSPADQDLPPPHVPNAAEKELLAIARKNYLTLQSQKRKNRIYSVWNTRYAQRPLGAVPDFSTAHTAALEQRLYKRAAAIQQGVTIPQEFLFKRASKASKAARMQRLKRQRQNFGKVLNEQSGISHIPTGTQDDEGQRVCSRPASEI